MARFTRRRWLAASALAAFFGHAASPRFSFADAPSLPWRNWSGGLTAQPRGRFSPASEDELAQFLADTDGPLRPVGSGHSFSPLVPTHGHLVVIDRLQGVLAHDAARMQATVAAGTRLGDLGGALDAIGQAMYNLPDIDRQTLAGATATATHGTGIEFGCLSSYVTALRLVTPAGEVRDVDAQTDADLLAAARVSLGALGIITRMTIANTKPFRLRQRQWVEKTEALLDAFDEHAGRHRQFEIFPYTHSHYAIAVATDLTDAPIHNPPPSPEEDAGFIALIEDLSKTPPRDRLPIIDAIAGATEPTEHVDVSWRILSHVRNVRFNEMEYSVPLAAGADCLREILKTIIEREIDVVFPLEYRYVKRDDTWLGMSSGDEDHAAISIHRAAQFDYRPYFDAIEPIFWKYGGRPHWGKIHSLGADRLEALYPRFRDFQKLRLELDPRERMLNEHLRKLFSVRS